MPSFPFDLYAGVCLFGAIMFLWLRHEGHKLDRLREEERRGGSH